MLSGHREVLPQPVQKRETLGGKAGPPERRGWYAPSRDCTVFRRNYWVMQTLIIQESKSAEGRVIQAVTIPWKEILKLINGDPHLIYQIDPWKWEEIIAGSYKASGLFDEVVLTPRSGDHGRDVIATKHGFCSIRCIESVKRYTPGKVVDADDVRSLGFAMLANPKVNKGVVSTTWEFAPRIEDDPNIKSLIPHRLELVNRDALIERFKSWGKLD